MRPIKLLRDHFRARHLIDSKLSSESLEEGKYYSFIFVHGSQSRRRPTHPWSTESKAADTSLFHRVKGGRNIQWSKYLNLADSPLSFVKICQSAFLVEFLTRFVPQSRISMNIPIALNILWSIYHTLHSPHIRASLPTQSCPRVRWTRGSGRVTILPDFGGSGRVSTSDLLVFYWLFLGTLIDMNLRILHSDWLIFIDI